MNEEERLVLKRFAEYCNTYLEKLAFVGSELDLESFTKWYARRYGSEHSADVPPGLTDEDMLELMPPEV